MKNFLISAGEEDRKRNRRALIVFLIGLVFVIWAWMNMVVRVMYGASNVPIDLVSPVDGDPVEAPTMSDTQRREKGRLLAKSATPLLLVGLLLVLVFLAGTYVLVRSSRRFLDRTRRERAAPTPVPDIWSTHKVPEFPEEEEDEFDRR